MAKQDAPGAHLLFHNMPVRKALAVFAVAAMCATAQDPAQQEPAPIRVEVNLVNILCSVRNKQGGLVGNLTKDDFQVFEEGKAQTIKYFARETDLPLTIGLLVDVSKSQERLIDIEKQAAEQFFNQVLGKKDMAFLISFGQDAELLQDYTGSPRLLRAGLNELKLSAPPPQMDDGPVPTMNKPRGTILYDAVYLAAHDKLQGQVGRKAIVLISDGIDEGSRYKIQEALRAAQIADTVIYGIEYYDASAYGYGGFGSFGGGGSELKRFSDETGGRVFKVSKKHPLTEAFEEIQQEMRTQYAIGYESTNPTRDGSFRRIDIRMHDKDLKVQARKGYFATAAEANSGD
jgi:VWFA-related protein